MKKYCVLLACTALLASAESDRTLFVYHSSGIEPIFFAEVERMKISSIDIDSVDCGFPVVQEIWTPDSVYRYPLDEIKRISFRSPDPEPVAGAINIADELEQYITATSFDDGITLQLRDATPESAIPDRDALLYRYSPSDLFPYGLSAKVSYISGNTLFCEPVDPETMFNSLAWTTDTSFDSEGITSASARKKITTSGLLFKPEYPVFIEGVLVMTDELRDIPAGPERSQIKGHISVSPSVRCLSGSYVLKTDDGKFLRRRRLFTSVRASVDARINGRYNVEEKHTVKQDPAISFSVPMGLGGQATLSYVGTMVLEGKMGLDYSMQASYNSSALMTVDFFDEDSDPHFDFTTTNKGAEVRYEKLDASMDGEAQISGSLTLAAAWPGDDLKSLSNVFTYGTKLKGSALFLSSEIADAYDNNALYQRLTSTGIKASSLESIVSVCKYYASTIKNKAKIQPAGGTTFYVVPKFENPVYDKTTSSISYRVAGAPMNFSSASLGTAVLHADGAFSRNVSDKIWGPQTFRNFSADVSFKMGDDVNIYPTATLPTGETILGCPPWPTNSNVLFPVISVLQIPGTYINSGLPMTGYAKSGNHVMIVGNPIPVKNEKNK